MSNGPIFIVGPPRSGTSMLRLMLNAHPHLAVPDETSFFNDFYKRPQTAAAQPWPEMVNAFIGHCAKRFRPEVDLEPVRQRLLGLETPDYAQLLAAPLAAWSAAQEKTRWGEKTPLHVFFGPDIIRLFPDAKVILLQRDPRATVASMNRFPHASSDSVLNAWLWHDVATRGAQTLTASVPPSQLAQLRYEDLVGAPEAELRRLCGFLGETFTATMLDFHRSVTSYQARVVTEKITKPVRDDRESWREHLSADDVACIEAICRRPMMSLGYEPGPRPAPLRGRLDIGAAWLYIRARQRLRHRDVRYRMVSTRSYRLTR